MERRTCHVRTYGCRVNQADSEGILEALEQRDFRAVEDFRAAEVVVINSCTVTHRSDADVRKIVQRMHRENPGARVVVTGCSAQRDPQALIGLPGLAAVVGHASPATIAEVATRAVSPNETLPLVLRHALDDPDSLPPVEPIALVHDRTRPFVKIQDGCDAHCTYCIIPSVRGAARSATIEHVLASVRSLIARGYFEIVLTGIHLGTYGRDHGEDLSTLVQTILAEPVCRLRLSCIEPMAFPLALLDLAKAEPRLAPHFHLPLQSGCDRVLKRMGRPYRAADYVDLMRTIRRSLPDVCLGSDVIVGFPGEREDDFAETLSICEAAELDYVHVFSYSDRAGTPSARLGPKVASKVIKERSARLRAWSEARWSRFLGAQVGREFEVVTLLPQGDTVEGLSAHFCTVQLRGTYQRNQRLLVRIDGHDGQTLFGAEVA